MEGLFLGGSLAAAFLAGAVALFAPCCITVMMPAYLAASVKNQRWRLVPLTFVFGAGVAVILLPITLGLTILSRGLLQYHGVVYGAGGVLLLAMALAAAGGASWSLPIMRGAPDIQRTDSGGVFALGVFSGAASACCAPVLAGVLTLSAVAPSILTSMGIGLAYVFGMVFPLLVVTLAWDRYRANRPALRPKQVAYEAFGRRFTTTRLSLVSAGLFSIMGFVLITAAVTGAELTSSTQVEFAASLETRLKPVADFFSGVPDIAVGVVLVVVAVAAVVYSGRRRQPVDQDSPESRDRSCHEQDLDNPAHL